MPLFIDGSAVPGANHRYEVVAFDTAGNMSDPSGSVSVGMPQPPTQTRFTAPHDATLSRPDSNRGDRHTVEVDLSSRKDGLLRFDLVGIGTPASVTLRLYVPDSSSNGGDVRFVTDSAWSEDTVT